MGFSLKKLISPVSSLINPTKLLSGMFGGPKQQLMQQQQQPQQPPQQPPPQQFSRQWTMPYQSMGGYGMPQNGMMQPFQGGWNSQFGGGRSMMPQQPMRFDPRQYMQQQQFMRQPQQMPQQNPWMQQQMPRGMFGMFR